jgi:uncharacterized protein (DUF302 family)
MPAAVEHVSVPTGLDYDSLVSAFEREVGRWDPAVGNALVAGRAPWSDVEQEVERAGGKHGLMIFFRVDQGLITSLSGKIKQCSLYLVGNPVIANQIIDIDLGGSFYVPFRVCLYDAGEPGGAVIGYDRPSSFLALLGRAELKEIGALLDRKIECVVDALLKSVRPD